MEPFVKTKSLTKNFGAVRALTDVDFEVHRGEVVALVGDNGAGKSTLINIISGMYPPTKGEIYIDGKRISHLTTDVALDLGIQTVHQGFGLVGCMSIERNLVLGREPTKRMLLDGSKMKSMTNEMLERTGIRSKLGTHSIIDQLSGGERQSVKIGRSIFYQAKLLILDEPAVGLSVRETARVLEMVNTAKAGNVALIFITHDIHQVYEVADRIVILEAGMKIADFRKETKRPEEIIGMIREPYHA